METAQIQSLLQHVGLIRKKYEDFAEITGENFNVFDILNVSTNEMSHSSFVCFLLDVKAKHGQKDLFLKLFIEQIKNQFDNEKNDILNQFETIKSHAVTEKSIGYKSDDVSNGGRIDIIINDGKNNIIIENKIYAGDQEKQMMRYHNYDPNAPLIYLSLGDENPSDDSITHEDKKLELNKDFISISYKSDIKLWIEECIKSVYDKPLIRETLRQYVFLINELTNQSNNKKMSEEIVNIVTRDVESFNNFQFLLNSQNNIYEQIISKLRTQIEDLNLGLELTSFDLSNKKSSKFKLTNSELEKENLMISFEFAQNNFKEMDFGFILSDEKQKSIKIENHKKLREIFKSFFGEVSNTEIWPAYSGFLEYRNWSHDSQKNFGAILDGKMIEMINEKVTKMLLVFDEYLLKK